MSDSSQTPTAAPPPVDQRRQALIIYVLLLCHFVPVIGWVGAIVGLVLAYAERDRAPDWLKSHFTFQIRTFWIGLVYWLVSICLWVVIIGVPLLALTVIWFIVRCALGLSRLNRDEAYPNPTTWMF